MQLWRPIQTRFRFGSAPEVLNLATYRNSLARSTKSTLSLALQLLVSTGFQFLFHSPPGVLFTFPSRYYFAIGHWLVFRLGGWAPHLPTGFHVSRGTRRISSSRFFAYARLTLFAGPSHALLLNGNDCWILGSSSFARRYLRNRCFFLFLRVLRCFSSPGSLR